MEREIKKGKRRGRPEREKRGNGHRDFRVLIVYGLIVLKIMKSHQKFPVLFFREKTYFGSNSSFQPISGEKLDFDQNGPKFQMKLKHRAFRFGMGAELRFFGHFGRNKMNLTTLLPAPILGPHNREDITKHHNWSLLIIALKEKIIGVSRNQQLAWHH